MTVSYHVYASKILRKKILKKAQSGICFKKGSFTCTFRFHTAQNV